MIQNDYSLEPQVSNEITGDIINQGARDLIVLTYMAQKIRIALHDIEKPSDPLYPVIYLLKSHHHRKQRIILYNPELLLKNTNLSFVGFVSRKQKTVDPSIDNEIQKVDALLTKELVNAPGILCYSSLELGPGKWYNLVLLADFNIKTHLKNSPVHCYAAYQLAAHYYQWIRLHSGIITEGLSKTTLLLQKTKYYTCQAPEPRFIVHELTYA